tara:strand:+ start:654 stop:1445 length:792 start_codon:yes stop_codon:yes gene_type:complete
MKHIIYIYIFHIINIIFYLLRIKYLFIKEICIKQTNSITNNISDKPKNIVSWNIQGLLYFLNPQKIKNIINVLNTFNHDIICLQEVFENSIKQQIINGLSKKYPYYLLGNTDKKYIVGEDSGLLVLSKYKIKFIKEVVLNDTILLDKLSNKSILYFSIGDLNFVNTHLQASDIIHNEIISKNQINNIFINAPFQSYIITGDLNTNNACKYTNSSKNNNINTCDEGILDYILPINTNYWINTNVINIDMTNTSDHKPLSGEIIR